MAPKRLAVVLGVLMATLLLVSSDVLAAGEDTQGEDTQGEYTDEVEADGGGGSCKYCCGGYIWYDGKKHCSHWCRCGVHSWCCGGYTWYGGKRHCKHWCH